MAFLKHLHQHHVPFAAMADSGNPNVPLGGFNYFSHPASESTIPLDMNDILFSMQHPTQPESQTSVDFNSLFPLRPFLPSTSQLVLAPATFAQGPLINYNPEHTVHLPSMDIPPVVPAPPAQVSAQQPLVDYDTEDSVSNFSSTKPRKPRPVVVPVRPTSSFSYAQKGKAPSSASASTSKATGSKPRKKLKTEPNYPGQITMVMDPASSIAPVDPRDFGDEGYAVYGFFFFGAIAEIARTLFHPGSVHRFAFTEIEFVMVTIWLVNYRLCIGCLLAFTFGRCSTHGLINQCKRCKDRKCECSLADKNGSKDSLLWRFFNYADKLRHLVRLFPASLFSGPGWNPLVYLAAAHRLSVNQLLPETFLESLIPPEAVLFSNNINEVYCLLFPEDVTNAPTPESITSWPQFDWEAIRKTYLETIQERAEGRIGNFARRIPAGHDRSVGHPIDLLSSPYIRPNELELFGTTASSKLPISISTASATRFNKILNRALPPLDVPSEDITVPQLTSLPPPSDQFLTDIFRRFHNNLAQYDTPEGNRHADELIRSMSSIVHVTSGVIDEYKMYRRIFPQVLSQLSGRQSATMVYPSTSSGSDPIVQWYELLDLFNMDMNDGRQTQT